MTELVMKLNPYRKYSYRGRRPTRYRRLGYCSFRRRRAFRTTKFRKPVRKLWRMFETKHSYIQANVEIPKEGKDNMCTTLVYNPFLISKWNSDMGEDFTQSILPFSESDKIYLKSLRLSGTIRSHVPSPVYMRIMLISTYLKNPSSGWTVNQMPIWRSLTNETQGFITDYPDTSKCRVIRRKIIKLTTVNEKIYPQRMFAFTVPVKRFIFPNRQDGANIYGKFNNLHWIYY